MKSLIGFLLCLMLVFPAFSEDAPVDPFTCDCGFDEEKGEKCACFLQEGDIGPFVNAVIVHLKERGYLFMEHARGVFDEEVTDAVKRFQYDMDLTETGFLDHETLSYLIFADSGLDMFLVSDDKAELMWTPTDGGIKVHKDPLCSQMIAPRKISKRNAFALGIINCEHCFEEGYHYDETLAGFVYRAGSDPDA